MDDLRCKKCSHVISKEEKYAVILFFVKDIPSSPYYEHLECPKDSPFSK